MCEYVVEFMFLTFAMCLSVYARVLLNLFFIFDCHVQLAPQGLTDVTLMMCGTCANENAFKAAFIGYMVTL